MYKINRLKNRRAYLCGAIDRVADRGKGWREHITPVLKDMGVVVWSPLTKPIEIGAEDDDTHAVKTKLKKSGKYDELSDMMRIIRNVDLRMVDVCDFMIVNLDLEQHACGTYEEIFLANRQKKPIIVHIEQGKQNAPDWLFGAIPHNMIYSKWIDIFDYLWSINEAESIETYKRWYFFEI